MKIDTQFNSSEVLKPAKKNLNSLQIDQSGTLTFTNFDNLKLSSAKTNKPVNLIIPEKLFSQSGTLLISPEKLFKDGTPSAGYSDEKIIADGVLYNEHLKTSDGGVVHVLTIQPDKAEISVEFSEKGKPVLPSGFKDKKNFIGAINGQFFDAAGTIGDMKAGNKVFLDENVSSDYDKASDKRYFVSITTDGKVKTGKGGIIENGNINDYKMFLGGMCLLYSKEQLVNLDQDIKSGEFSKRIIFSGSSQKETISRSFLGITKDGKLLLVAAGEGALRAKGLNFVEAAHLMKNLGAEEAYILDGGGSTSMLVKGMKPANTDGRAVKSYISINSI